jgi:hypothetical protein
MFFHYFFIKKFIKYYLFQNIYKIIKTNFNHYILFIIIFILFQISNLNISYCECESESESEIEDKDFEKIKKILIITGLICVGLMALYYLYKPWKYFDFDYDSDSSSSSSESSGSILNPDLEEKPKTTSRFITIPTCRQIVKKKIYDRWYGINPYTIAVIELKEGEEVPHQTNAYLKKLYNIVD